MAPIEFEKLKRELLEIYDLGNANGVNWSQEVSVMLYLCSQLLNVSVGFCR
jgi:hypothetical protein